MCSRGAGTEARGNGLTESSGFHGWKHVGGMNQCNQTRLTSHTSHTVSKKD